MKYAIIKVINGNYFIHAESEQGGVVHLEFGIPTGATGAPS